MGLKKKRAIVVRKDKIVLPKLFYMVFLLRKPENEHSRFIREFEGYLRKPFEGWLYDLSMNIKDKKISISQPLNCYSFFVATNDSFEFEKKMKKSKKQFLLLKIEASTKKEVVEFFKGKEKFRFEIKRKYDSIFDFFFRICMFHSVDDWFRKKREVVSIIKKEGDKEEIIIRGISKEGIEYIKMIKKLLEEMSKKKIQEVLDSKKLFLEG